MTAWRPGQRWAAPCDLDHPQSLSHWVMHILIYIRGQCPIVQDKLGQRRKLVLCTLLSKSADSGNAYAPSLHMPIYCLGKLPVTPACPWLTSDSFLCLWLSQFDDEDAALEYEEGGEAEDEGEEVPGDDEGEGGEFRRALKG